MATNFSNKALNNFDWDGIGILQLTDSLGMVTLTGNAAPAGEVVLPPTPTPATTAADSTNVRYDYLIIINDPNGRLSLTNGVQLTAGTGTVSVNGDASNPIIFSATAAGNPGIIEIRCIGNGNFTAVDPNKAFTTEGDAIIQNGDILVGNANNIGASVTMTGDITINNTGVTAIANNIPITAFRPLATITANETLNAGDEGKFFVVDSGVGNNPVTVTLSAAYSVAANIGTEGDFILARTGALTFTPAAGVTINGVNANVVVSDQWGGITIKLIAVNTWIAIGKI